VKILHLIPSLTSGGAERQLGYLTRELERRGHEVRIAYLYPGPAPWQSEGLPAEPLVARRHRDPRLLAEIVRRIRAWRPDVLQTWYVESDIVGGVAAALTRTPWVLREPNTGRFYERRVKAPLRKAMARALTAAVVANSEGGCAYWGNGARLIRNAVPVGEIDRVAPAEPGGRPVVVYTGRLEAIKNVDVVIAAAAAANASVIVCGAGPQRAALELLSGGRVRFMGHTREVWPVVKGADLFVSLSDFEGAPNSTLEAFAARTPALLSDIPAHRALAGDHAAFFAPPRDVDATAAAIRAALADRDGAAARARIARLRVESMTVEAMADGYEEVYEEAASR